MSRSRSRRDSRSVALSLAARRLRDCGNPSIAELKYNPGRYQDRTVTVDGVVTSSWGVPLVPFKLYKVDDGTGEVTVVSQGRPRADKGARVRVKGTRRRGRRRFGGQSLGLHLRAEGLDFKQLTEARPLIMRNPHDDAPSCRRSAACRRATPRRPRRSRRRCRSRADRASARRSRRCSRSAVNSSPVRVHRLEHAVACRTRTRRRRAARTSPRRRSTRGNDPSGTPGSSICGAAVAEQRIGYGRPEFASVTVRRFRSKIA